MSDFLDQFRNKNYRPAEPEEPADGKDAAESVKPADSTEPEDRKEPAYSMKPAAFVDPSASVEPADAEAASAPPTAAAGPAAPARFEPFKPRRTGGIDPAGLEPGRRRGAGVRGVEHDVVIDTSYNRLKVLRYVLVSLTVLALCVLGFFAYRYFNSVEMLTFEGKNVSEARTWALKNRIELDITYAFNVQTSAETVIDQGVEPGETVQKGSVLPLTVSKGPDPDERLVLPDFETMSTAEVRAWITDNKATNINLIQSYDKQVPANGFIRMEFTDVSVDETNFTRRDYLIIYMSRGPEPVQEYISVPDFTGYTKSQVDSWLQSNPVLVFYTEEGHDTVAAGSVFGQDVEPGSTVAVNAEIHLQISIGKGETVPDFAATNSTEAATYAPGLTVAVKTQYSNDVPYGSLISQSVAAGEILYGDDKKLTVVYSEGRPYIGQLAGRMENELPAYFFAFNTKGCSLSYSVTYIDSHETKGMIVEASRFNEYLWLGSGVQFYVSRGNLPPPTQPVETTPPTSPPTTDPTTAPSH